MSRNAYAAKVGVTPAYITKCRRLGTALAGGVEYGTSTWQDLSKVVNSGEATRKLLDATDETGALVPLDLDALVTAVKADGDKSKAASAKGGKAASTAQDAQTPVPTESEVKADTLADKVKAAMTVIRDAVASGDLAESDLAALDNGIVGVRQDIVKAKADLAAKADKVKAATAVPTPRKRAAAK
jgi:hypothetical protein